jgi:hypothetical protein
MLKQDDDLIDLFLASPSGLPLDPTLTALDELLKAGRQAAWRDHQHELAHEYFVRVLAIARLKSDKAAIAEAVLAIGTHLVWYCPPIIDSSGISCDDPCECALRLFSELGDDLGVAASLRGLDRNEESLEVSRRIGDTRGVVRCLARSALLATSHKPQLAASHAYEAVQLARTIDDEESLALALESVGMLTQASDVDRRHALLEASRLFKKLGYRWAEARALLYSGWLTCDQEPALQDQLLEETCQLWQAMGNDTMEATTQRIIADIANKRQNTSKNPEARVSERQSRD